LEATFASLRGTDSKRRQLTFDPNDVFQIPLRARIGKLNQFFLLNCKRAVLGRSALETHQMSQSSLKELSVESPPFRTTLESPGAPRIFLGNADPDRKFALA
jgi:hypothetical protein